MPRVLEILSNILYPIEYSYGSTEVPTIYPTFSIAYSIYSTSHMYMTMKTCLDRVHGEDVVQLSLGVTVYSTINNVTFV